MSLFIDADSFGEVIGTVAARFTGVMARRSGSILAAACRLSASYLGTRSALVLAFVGVNLLPASREGPKGI